MDITALLLSRLQFAFTVSFHIIFPSFTIGLAAWLTVLGGFELATGRPAYRVVFEFWLKIFGVAFGLGVVSGIVMAFEFGTNWSELSRMSGPIQGPLLSYETFTAFFLEASFFGILLFGRSRVPPWFYLFSTAMVALGTTLSAFWIMVNNSWMQAPVGYAIDERPVRADRLGCDHLQPRRLGALPAHAARLAYLTGAFCVAATGAWYLLRGEYHAEARIMLRMGLFLAAVLVPVAALLRASRRRLCARQAASEVRRDRGPLARRAAGERGADRVAGRGGGDQPLRDQHPDPRQPYRQHELHLEGSRAYRLSGAGPAAGG